MNNNNKKGGIECRIEEKEKRDESESVSESHYHFKWWWEGIENDNEMQFEAFVQWDWEEEFLKKNNFQGSDVTLFNYYCSHVDLYVLTDVSLWNIVMYLWHRLHGNY